MAGDEKKAGKEPKLPIALDRAFGPNLRRCRKRAGYTQEALAQRAGLHRTEISLLERGLRNPGYDVVTRLLGALGVEPNELLKGTTWKPPGIGSKGRFVYRDPT